MVRLIKMLVEELVSPVVDFKPMTIHACVQSTFSFSNIYKSTQIALDTVHNIRRFAVQIIMAVRIVFFGGKIACELSICD